MLFRSPISTRIASNRRKPFRGQEGFPSNTVVENYRTVILNSGSFGKPTGGWLWWSVNLSYNGTAHLFGEGKGCRSDVSKVWRDPRSCLTQNQAVCKGTLSFGNCCPYRLELPRFGESLPRSRRFSFKYGRGKLQNSHTKSGFLRETEWWLAVVVC